MDLRKSFSNSSIGFPHLTLSAHPICDLFLCILSLAAAICSSVYHPLGSLVVSSSFKCISSDEDSPMIFIASTTFPTHGMDSWQLILGV
jgi:hypothetical protein